MENLKNRMRYFIKHDVKYTFRKKTAWIHLKEDQLYTVVTGMMKNYECLGQLVVKGKLDRYGLIVSD